MSTAFLGGLVQALAGVDEARIGADGGGVRGVPTPGLGGDPMHVGVRAEAVGGDGPQAVTGFDDDIVRTRPRS